MRYFLPFNPPNRPKNENFKKMKKISGDIIILHKCTKSHYHMLYCSWDMACDRCNCFCFFFILGNFFPFYPSKSPKNVNLFKNEKNKNAPEVSSFNTSVSKIMIIYFTVPEIWHVTDVIPILHNCTKNHENMLYCYWDMSCVTDVTVIFHFGLFFVSNDRKGLFIN